MPGMDKFTMTIKGAKSLNTALDNLEKKTRRKVVRKAIVAGAKPILKAARRNAPTLTGLLKLSLGTKVYRVRRRGDVMIALIGPRYRTTGKKAAALIGAGGRAAKSIPAKYAHLVEFGTQPHHQAKEGGPLSFLGIVTDYVEHPGAKKHPFMRPAWDKQWRRALRKTRQKLWQGIKAAQ